MYIIIIVSTYFFFRFYYTKKKKWFDTLRWRHFSLCFHNAHSNHFHFFLVRLYPEHKTECKAYELTKPPFFFIFFVPIPPPFVPNSSSKCQPKLAAMPTCWRYCLAMTVGHHFGHTRSDSSVYFWNFNLIFFFHLYKSNLKMNVYSLHRTGAL